MRRHLTDQSSLPRHTERLPEDLRPEPRRARPRAPAGSELVADDAVSVTVSATLVARVEQLEGALSRARVRAEELRRGRDELAVELERISRLSDVAWEASARLRPLGRQVAEGAASPDELARATAGVVQLLRRLRPRAAGELPQSVFRRAGQLLDEDLAAIDTVPSSRTSNNPPLPA